MFKRIKEFWGSFYQQFIAMDDSPQRIAMGFGLGVFLGILPFTGFVAAAALAWVLHLNKTAAVLGSVLTNTWLSIVVFGLAVNTGCLLLGLNVQDIQLRFQGWIKDFHWASLLDSAIWQIIGAVALGYLIVSVLLAILAYLICLGILYLRKP